MQPPISACSSCAGTTTQQHSSGSAEPIMERARRPRSTRGPLVVLVAIVAQRSDANPAPVGVPGGERAAAVVVDADVLVAVAPGDVLERPAGDRATGRLFGPTSMDVLLTQTPCASLNDRSG